MPLGWSLVQKTFDGDPRAGPRQEFPIVIATMPATARQRRTAFGAFVVLAVVVAVTLPFANVSLERVNAFVPVIQTVMCVADLLTAALLFAQYAVHPSRAVLALAAGYIFSGLFAFLQTLAFPGGYGPGALIGDQLNSAGWIFVLWHTSFPLAVIYYALAKDRGDAASRAVPPTGVTIAVTIACVAAATAALTWLATAGVGHLPSLYESTGRPAPFAQVANIFLSLATATALILLFVRRRTVLDHWLIVALFAWLPNFVVAVLLSVVRFSFGWYMARGYALFAGSAVLFALLAETVVLYTRLANAVVLLRREQADRLAIFNTVVDGIITIDRGGIVETLNPAAARLFGYAPDEVIGRNVKMLMPEPYRGEHDRYLANYLRTGEAKIIGIGREVTGLRKDGSTFPIELAVSETTVAGRRIFTGVVRDITERKRSERHQRLLIAELDHRVKNALARVAAVAEATRQGSSSIDAFIRTHKGRIQSMAAAHELLSEQGWQGVGLDALVRNQLAPYATDSNMTVSGTDVVLAAAAIQAVAMVLHELVTNAAKYGALSVPDGRVAVSWERRANGGADSLLRIEWRELDGPPVTAAIPSGYGTNLIRDLIPHELDGTVDLDFTARGAVCRIEIPLRATAGDDQWE
jgi:PAS domain S-box-containing protein